MPIQIKNIQLGDNQYYFRQFTYNHYENYQRELEGAITDTSSSNKPISSYNVLGAYALGT